MKDNDWDYRGKRPDQVEGSHKVFSFCVLAGLILALMYVIAGCQANKITLDYDPGLYRERIEWVAGRKMIIHELHYDSTLVREIIE